MTKAYVLSKNFESFRQGLENSLRHSRTAGFEVVHYPEFVETAKRLELDISSYSDKYVFFKMASSFKYLYDELNSIEKKRAEKELSKRKVSLIFCQRNSSVYGAAKIKHCLDYFDEQINAENEMVTR